MRNSRFIICFALMLILQLILTKYGQIGHFIFISILPAMVLCLPTSHPTWLTMIMAFICGLLVDFLADGQIGLNAAALVPVALMQKLFIRIFFGEDIVERHYSFSFWSHGIIKIGAAALCEVAIYMILYVILDCAGERSGSFILTKILLSTLVSFIFSLVAINILCPKPSR